MRNTTTILEYAITIVSIVIGMNTALGDLPRLKDIPVPESVEQCKEKAETGNLEAQASLIRYYMFHSNVEEAKKWLRKAAEHGYADAEWVLGLLLMKSDPREGVTFLRKAADKGLAEAQFALGRYCYYDGFGVDKDEAKALEWIGKAADQGYEDAIKFREMLEALKKGKEAKAKLAAALGMTPEEFQTKMDKSVEETQRAKTAQKFDGIFGVKFGTIISASKKCETNNVYSLAYEYLPEKKFNEFSDYVIFASPKTRTVYQIRGVYSCSDQDDAKKKIDEIVPLLEAKYGRDAKELEDGKIILFPNGDRIHVVLQSNWLRSHVFIDAVNGEFKDLADKESKEVKADILKSDMAALQILPKPEDSGNVTKITGLFGRSFGDKLPENKWFERNNNDALVVKMEVEKEFMGFSEYMAFATPESREIFMFRAIYSEDDDNTIRDKVVSLFEQIFGKNVQTGDDGDKYFVVNGIRSKCLVQINVQNDNVFLDVIDFSLYEKAEEQEKARKRQNYSSEMDAL